ncbi:MAG: phosphatidate cytidylyltransferase [Phycisphaerae bacterium]
MLNRLAYGAVAILALVTVVAADAFLADEASDRSVLGDLLRHGSLIPILFTLVVLRGVMEFVTILRAAGHKPCGGWAMLSCAVLMLSPWLCAGGILGHNPVDVEGLHWQVIWLGAAVLGAALIHVARGVSPNVIADLASTMLIILYLGFLPSFAIQLRADVDLSDPIAGAWTLLFVLAIVFVSDIAALYSGVALGRHRLAPSISPGKSIEGFVGGIIGSVLLAVAFWRLARIIGPEEQPADTVEWLSALADQMTAGIKRLTLSQSVLFGVAISVASQIGDLFESLLKRGAQVKDSSRLIPGMGGVLDVVDGTLFAVPLAWFLLTRFWHVV